jgi:Cys-tRNA(Pro)/Cys-tRNA(Cys) deacylase
VLPGRGRHCLFQQSAAPSASAHPGPARQTGRVPDPTPFPSTSDEQTPALAAVREAGLEHRVLRHGPVRSLAEAAQARGVAPADVVKTLVVRRGQDDFLLVLVPGDRQLSWPKLRALLAVSRLSLPDAALAREATGYERGTITPFGATRAWPVVADERVRGRWITLGAGAHGLAVGLSADDALSALSATVADVTEAE